MPIVIDYNDVEAFGALAYQAGLAGGQAQAQQQNQQLAAQLDARRSQAAAQMQQTQARQQQAAADRQLQRELMGQRQAFEREQARQAADAQQAQARMQRDMMQQRGRMQRDLFRHGLDMHQLEREVELGVRGDGGADAMDDLGPGGFPSRDRVQAEIRQFGHMIPFDPGLSESGEPRGTGAVQRDQEANMEIAETLASLPTHAIVERMRAAPDDPWMPFMRSIVEAREGIVPGGDIGHVGQPDRRPNHQQGAAMPEAGRRPGRGQQARRLGQGQGFGSNGLEGLSDAQLMQLANQQAAMPAAQPPGR